MEDLTLITIITLIISFFIIFIKIILKSKCFYFSCCWNFIEIKRDVKLEEKLEEIKIDKGIKSNNNLDEMQDINNNINKIYNNVLKNNIN